MACSAFRPALVRRIVTTHTQHPRVLKYSYSTRTTLLSPETSLRPKPVSRLPSIHRSFTSTSSTPTTSLPTSTPPLPQQPDSPPPPSRPYRILSATALLLLFTTLGLTLTASPSLPTLHALRQPPTDAETLSLWHPSTPSASAINSHITSCTLAQHLRTDASYAESRPILKIPASMRTHNLTAGTLLAEDGVSAPPLTFLDANPHKPRMVQIMHFGSGVCSSPGVVHPGLVATLLDEGLARACFPALPNKVGVTATLEVEYLKECPAERFVVLRAETTRVEGRKVWVKGSLELLDEGGGVGEVVAEAEALFIEPRGAKNMARIYSPSSK